MTTPDASQGDAEIYLVNAQVCSAGTGPGYATVPWDEAQGLIAAGYAIAGSAPPINVAYAGAVSPP
jgi:hypothetical protein